MNWFLSQARNILTQARSLYVGPAPSSGSLKSDRGKVHAAVRVFWSMMLASVLTALLGMFIVFRLHVIQAFAFAAITVAIEYACNYWQDYTGGKNQ